MPPKKLNLATTVANYLKDNPEMKFTAREIAEWIPTAFPDECAEKQKRSEATVEPLNDHAGLVKALAAEIGSQRDRIFKKDSGIKTTEERPMKYYFTESTDTDEVRIAEGNKDDAPDLGSSTPTKEHDLYPKLAKYLWSESEIFCKRIDEKKSRNTRGAGGNRWLYPDLVGVKDLSSEWDNEIKKCVKSNTDKTITLWSFEVKILINHSNVREAYFQAVSNSTWANFGYLVASEVQGAHTFKELRILAGLHGIGFIRLDVDNPPESQIMIPAKERNEIDWDIANRLTEENEDFMEYIKCIRHFYQTGDITLDKWEKRFDDD